MSKYIGAKIVDACPMDKGTFEATFREVPGSESMGPKTSGYQIIYGDGYVSWSPGAAFDAAYRECDSMTFGLAIEAMMMGKKVARKGWNGKGIFIEIQFPDKNSKMTGPYIFIDTTGLQTDNEHAPKTRIPWLASQSDMLSEDWTAVE